MLTLDLQSRIPLFEQIKQGLIRLIAYGVLPAHEQLPSVRGLAQELGVNPNTVQKAYQQLEAEGIIYSSAGRGSFVAEQTGQREARYQVISQHVQEVFREAHADGFPQERIESLLRLIYDKGGEPQ